MAGDTINIALVGVGGQGVLTASDVLATVAMLDGREVKKSELHGMAQRGGSVVSHVRIGDVVHSPVIPASSAQFMVAFDGVEAQRYARLLAAGARIIMDDAAMHRVPGADVVAVPAAGIAAEAGNPRTAGSVLLGALSTLIPLSPARWDKAFATVLPDKVLAANLAAFRLGRAWMAGRAQEFCSSVF